jgi:hypothetical protein
MKVKSRTILKAVIIGLLTLIICTTYIMKSVGYSMVDHMIHYSTGIEESKKNGMFLGFYRPLKDSLVLDTLKLKTENIWYERNWTTDHNNLMFKEKIRIKPGIHLIVPYTSLLSSNLNVDSWLKSDCNSHFDSNGKVSQLGYANTLSIQPDTLVVFFGTDYGYGHKDSIIYVRK